METGMLTHISRIERITILLLALLFCLVAPAGASDVYPLRPYYPEVPFISTDKLLDTYDSTIIVDIRSSFEYDVARINKAKLLPLTDSDFAEKLEAIRPKEDKTPMAFYCNGHSCAKSYQAAQLSISLGFENVYVYDGGIFDWITAAPDKATLMGTTPARRNRIISTEEFMVHQAPFQEFAARAQSKNAVVIDIRDPFQREVEPMIKGIRNIPLDPLLDLVTSRIWKEKTLLFFDAVGKQVRWLQYFLESYGYYDYYFLNGGVRAISDDPSLLRPVIATDRTITSSQAMLLKLAADHQLDNTDKKILNYLLANVKFNNYVVIELNESDKAIGVGPHLVLNSVKKLCKLGYATHTAMPNMVVVQIDPRLAWKGKVGSKIWKTKVAEFEAAQSCGE